MKDWTGNTTSVFKTLGASNHADCERQSEDYYATDPFAAQLLLQVETFSDHVWEPACGEKHLSKVFEGDGYQVRSSDLVDRCGNEVYDFLSEENTLWDGDIITNPPYKFATQFVQKAVDIIPNGRKVAMFLKLQFLEGKERRKLFEKYPPHTVYVSSSRILCAPNGKFEEQRKTGSAVAYAWFVWEKGYKGDTIIKWIN